MPADSRGRRIRRAVWTTLVLVTGGATVWIVALDGFTSTAITTAVSLVMRMPMPFKIFGNVEGAAYFLVNKLPLENRPTSQRLVMAIAALRRDHERGALKVVPTRFTA